MESRLSDIFVLKKSIRHTLFADPKLDKELFLEEYKTLRAEILQRINILTTITGFILAAWGALIGRALESSIHQVDILLLYPIIAGLTSYSWAYNNTRIFQIGYYIRCREEDIANSEWGLMFWECYIHSPESKTRFKTDHRLQGYLLFIGTEAITLLLAFIIKYSSIKILIENITRGGIKLRFFSEHAYIEIIFFVLGFLAIFSTYSFIKTSQERLVVAIEK